MNKRQTEKLGRLGAKVSESITARDAAVAEAIAGGATYREVGDAVGMSFVAVGNIAKRAGVPARRKIEEANR